MGRDRENIRRIEVLLLPVLSEYNFQLVDIEIVRGRNRSVLRIFIDKMGGITVDDLAAFNHRIGDVIDAEGIFEHSYTLEVSSPGLNRRIRYPVDFDSFAGRKVKIKSYNRVEGSNQITGTLLGMKGNDVIVSKEGKTVLVNIDNIEHANLIYEWGNSDGGMKNYDK